MDEVSYTDEQKKKPDLSAFAPADLGWVHPAESNGSGGMCVEVAGLPDGVVVRDSADPDRVLGYSYAEFDVFLRAVQSGEFDQFRALSDRV